MEGRNAGGFDEKRIFYLIFHHHDHRVKALDMPHLYLQLLGFGYFQKLLRLPQLAGNRFFQKDVFTRFQSRQCKFIVRHCRGGDIDGIRCVQKRLIALKSGHAQLFGYFPRPCGIFVVDTAKLCPGHIHKFGGVVLPQMPHAYYANF